MKAKRFLALCLSLCLILSQLGMVPARAEEIQERIPLETQTVSQVSPTLDRGEPVLGTEYPALTLGATESVAIEEPGQIVYFSFTPSQTEGYALSSSYRNQSYVDTFAELYDSQIHWLADDDSSKGNGHFRLHATLTAGETYYFGVKLRDNAQTDDFYVTLELAHDYSSANRVEATCTEGGSETFSCVHCGDSYTQRLPAGHKWIGPGCRDCELDVLDVAVPLTMGTVLENQRVEAGEALLYRVTAEKEELYSLTFVPTGCTGSVLSIYDVSMNLLEQKELAANESHTTTEMGLGEHLLPMETRYYEIRQGDTADVYRVSAEIGHDFAFEPLSPETCTQPEKLKKTCIYCGHEEITNGKDPLRHAWSGELCIHCGMSMDALALPLTLGETLTDLAVERFAQAYVSLTAAQTDMYEITAAASAAADATGNTWLRLLDGEGNCLQEAQLQEGETAVCLFFEQQAGTTLYVELNQSLHGDTLSVRAEQVHAYEQTVEQDLSCTKNAIFRSACTFCGHSYTWEIGAYGHSPVEGGLCGECGLDLTTALPELTLGTEVTAAPALDYETLQYRFTPAENENYCLRIGGQGLNINVTLVGSDGNFAAQCYTDSADQETRMECELEAGKTYILSGNIPEGPRGSYTITAEVCHSYVDGICKYCADDLYLGRGTCGENLTWTLDKEGTLTISGTGAMDDYSQNGTTVPWTPSEIKSLVIENGVTSIGPRAFYGCSDLKEVSISQGVSSIGYMAFYMCKALTKVTLPASLTELGSNVFEGCSGLKTAGPLGSGCDLEFAWTETLPKNAFCGSSVRSVILPDTLTAIGDSAFRSCVYLEEINIPNGVTTIGSKAFMGCAWLLGIDLPDSVSQLGESAFYETGLTSIAFPANLSEIPDRTFYGCNGLETVTIPGTVTSIGHGAFQKCTKLTTVTIQEGVTSMGDSVFSGCTALSRVTIPGSVMELSSSFNLCPNLKTLGPMGGGYDIEVGWKTAVPDSAFYMNSILTTVVIPEGVTRLGSNAFSRCGNLEKVTVPASVTDIGNPGVGAFNKCEKLKTAGPIGGGYDFEFGWTEAIPDNGLRSLSGLTSVVLPASITAIGENAFQGCGALAEVTIPNGVTVIGEQAFWNCASLTEITIPASVTNIYVSAFRDCTSLTRIVFLGSNPGIYRPVFDGVTADAYYPADDATWTETVRQTCGGTLTWIPMEGHTHSWKDATCTAPKTCSICGKTEGEPLAHSWTDATCTAPKTCSICGETEGEPLEHIWDQGVTTQEPSYTAPGVTTFTCTLCAATRTEEIPQLDGTVIFRQISVSTAGDIGLNYYLELSEDLVSDPTSFLRFTFDDQVQDVPLSQAIRSGGNYRFSCKLAAKDMACPVTAQFYTAAGAVGAPGTSSVRDYCTYVIGYYGGTGQQTALVELLRAMLNYGAQSQISLKHNMSDLANTGLSAADQALPVPGDLTAYAARLSGREEGIQVTNASLILRTTTTIRVYFQLTGDKPIGDYAFTSGVKTLTPVKSGAQYYVDLVGIEARNLDTMYEIRCGGLTARYSGLSYVKGVLDYAGSPETSKNMARALWGYAMAANAYFGN